MLFKQCKLKRGKWYKYVWLPERYAKQGKVLKILEEDGWVVQAVYGSESEERIKARERDYKRWRRVTDV